MLHKSPEADHLWFDQSSSSISLKLCRLSLPLYTGLILSLTSGGNNKAAAGPGMAFASHTPLPERKTVFPRNYQQMPSPIQVILCQAL